jgi:hypothetical protein
MVNPVQAAVGIIVLLVTVGALLYIFISRTNAVEKTGYGALTTPSIASSVMASTGKVRVVPSSMGIPPSIT